MYFLPSNKDLFHSNTSFVLKFTTYSIVKVENKFWNFKKVHTFEYMKIKPIVIRPDKNNPDLEQNLRKLAEKKEWSLNKFIVRELVKISKKYSK